MNTKPLYKRVLLKLSGEALQGEMSGGFCTETLKRFAEEIAKVTDLGIQVAVVVGGGNFVRGASCSSELFNRTSADQIGMLATVMNGIALRDALNYHGKQAKVFCPFGLLNMTDNYNFHNVMQSLDNGTVAILSGGTGNPFCTTDSAAVLRAIEVGCDIVLKATNVDGIYSADPRKNASAELYRELTFQDVLDKELKVMDYSSFILARDHKLPIRVFNIHSPNNLIQVVQDLSVGTLVKL